MGIRFIITEKTWQTVMLNLFLQAYEWYDGRNKMRFFRFAHKFTIF